MSATNRKTTSTPPWPLYALLVGSLVLNAVLLFGGGSAPEAPVEGDAETLEEDAGLDEPALPGEEAATDRAGDAGAAGGKGQARDQVGLPGEATTAPAPAGDWITLKSPVEQSLARTFQLAAGADGDALSSVYTRLFVWDLDLRKDMQKGDAVAVVWRKGADNLPEIAAASLTTRKLGRTVAAYRWKAPGDRFTSYWHPDGSEAPLRLKNGPLADYEQITSLLKDRPTHKGMDFKTPVGTEVVSPKAGTVTRVNWNWGANGNCIEVRFEDGVLAKFLHLSENRVKEGQRVTAGQVIALSGNTGHSTAPHLHYQLDRADRTLDPLDYHGTERRSLAPDQVAAMKRDVAGYGEMLGGQ